MNDLLIQWNNFVTKHGPKSGAFLQSWEWGEFQQMMERKILRYVFKDDAWVSLNEVLNQGSGIRNQEFDGLVSIIKMPLPLGRSYLYVPKGPVTISGFRFQVSDFIHELKKLAEKEGAIFVKMELPIEKSIVAWPVEALRLRSGNNINKPRVVNGLQPKDTLILNLEKSEKELLEAMREKTRYNIGLAERKGVQVRWSTPKTLEQDLEKFWRLAQETARRDRFSYHPKSYYQKMLATNGRPTMIEAKPRIEVSPRIVRLVIAEKDGETLAANIIVFFGNTVTYLHGASNYARRELMAPHLLQWRVIQEAKQQGFRYYDFWGISPNSEFKIQNSESKHPWAGITRFKIGFGGEIINYAPTIDLPVNNFWYKLYCLAKKMRL